VIAISDLLHAMAEATPDEEPDLPEPPEDIPVMDVDGVGDRGD
jgi:hypothetical protein